MDGTTNIGSLIYRRLKQDQNDGIMKPEIDEIRSERYAFKYMSGAASADLSSALCSFGTLLSGGVKFHLKTVVFGGESGGTVRFYDGVATAANLVLALRHTSGQTKEVTNLQGIYFKTECRVAQSGGSRYLTVGGILELTDGPY